MAGLFGKVIKGILIGGGTILAALCPPVGGAVITAGMAIGTGAVAAGTLIQPKTPITIDPVVTGVNNFLQNTGLAAPQTANKGFQLTTTAWLMIAAAFGFILLIFKRR